MEDRSVPALDDVTADRLLAGGIAPDDAPPGYQDVARALHAAALSATDAPTQDGTTAVAAFLAAIPTRRTARMKKWKIAAATLAGGLTLSTGLAAADVLPGAAQDVASDALAKVGISVPSKHNDNADSRGKSAEHKKAKKAKDAKVADDTSPSTTKPDNHGSVVSKVAGDKTTEGADHGSAVCATASGGKCQPNGSNPAAPPAKGGQGSVNSTEKSDNSADGAANGGQTSTESETTSSGGTSSGSSSSSGGSSSSSGGGSSSSVSNGSGTTN